MNADRGTCAYCHQPATTNDHVPPKKLFTPPLPSDLILSPRVDHATTAHRMTTKYFGTN